MTVSRAAVMQAPGRISVREFSVPDPEPGAVVARVSLSGICGTDKHTFRGESEAVAVAQSGEALQVAIEPAQAGRAAGQREGVL